MEKWTPGLIAFPGAQLGQATGCLNCYKPKPNTVSCACSQLHLPGLFYCTGLHLSKTHLHQEGAHQTNSTETQTGRQSQQHTPKRISIPSAIKADSTGGPETAA